MDVERLLLLLALVYLAGRVGAEVAERLGQPGVVGEILAGVVIGPALLGWIPMHGAELDALEAIAELGVVFLLFSVGLETDLTELRRVGGIASAVAVIGVVVPFVLGGGLMLVLGDSVITAAFVGTAMVATSVGVTARVLRDKGKLSTREARIILGAAVVDDVLALLVLGGVSSVAGGEFTPLALVILVLEAAAFLVIAGTFGRRLLRSLFPLLHRLKMTEPALGIAVAIALGLAALSARIGLGAIIGAFLGGVIVGEPNDEELEHKFMPLTTFFVPFFFVYVGSRVDASAMSSLSSIGLVLLITFLGVIGKLAGGIPALRLGRREAAIVGIGMVPRGEVGIVVASLGLGVGVIDAELYSIVVVMCVLTTIIAPPGLQMLFRANGNSNKKPN